MSDQVKIRADVPLSLHPDQAAPWRDALDVDATVGQSVYRLSRELSAGLYSAAAAMQDAIKAVSATIDPNSPHKAMGRRKAGDDREHVMILSGREPELREGMTAAFDRAARDAKRRSDQIEKTIEAMHKRIADVLKYPGEDTPS